MCLLCLWSLWPLFVHFNVGLSQFYFLGLSHFLMLLFCWGWCPAASRSFSLALLLWVCRRFFWACRTPLSLFVWSLWLGLSHSLVGLSQSFSGLVALLNVLVLLGSVPDWFCIYSLRSFGCFFGLVADFLGLSHSLVPFGCSSWGYFLPHVQEFLGLSHSVLGLSHSLVPCVPV